MKTFLREVSSLSHLTGQLSWASWKIFFWNSCYYKLFFEKMTTIESRGITKLLAKIKDSLGEKKYYEGENARHRESIEFQNRFP